MKKITRRLSLLTAVILALALSLSAWWMRCSLR